MENSLAQQRHSLEAQRDVYRQLLPTLPDPATIHIGEGYFATVSASYAREFIGRKLDILERELRAVYELDGINDEGLPILDIVEELDDADEVVSASLHKTGLAEQLRAISKDRSNDGTKEAGKDQGEAPQPTRLAEEKKEEETEETNDQKKEPVVNVSADAVRRKFEDKTQGEFRDIDPADILELQLEDAESDDEPINFDFDDLEEEDEEDDDDDDDDEDDVRVSLFPQNAATRKLIETHLRMQTMQRSGSVNVGKDRSAGAQEVSNQPAEEQGQSVTVPEEPAELQEDGEAVNKSAEPSTVKAASGTVERPKQENPVSDVVERSSEVPKVESAAGDSAEASITTERSIESITVSADHADEASSKKKQSAMPLKPIFKKPIETRQDEKEASVTSPVKEAAPAGYRPDTRVRFSDSVDVCEFETSVSERKVTVSDLISRKPSRFKSLRQQAAAKKVAEKQQARKQGNGVSAAAAAAAAVVRSPPKQQPVKKTEPVRKVAPAPNLVLVPSPNDGPSAVPSAGPSAPLSAPSSAGPAAAPNSSQPHQTGVSNLTAEEIFEKSFIPDEEFLKLHEKELDTETPQVQSPEDDKPILSTVRERAFALLREEGDDDDTSFVNMKEIKHEYQKLRQRLIYGAGGFVKRDSEREFEPVGEDGQPKKISRFRSARIG